MPGKKINEEQTKSTEKLQRDVSKTIRYLTAHFQDITQLDKQH